MSFFYWLINPLYFYRAFRNNYGDILVNISIDINPNTTGNEKLFNRRREYGNRCWYRREVTR